MLLTKEEFNAMLAVWNEHPDDGVPLFDAIREAEYRKALPALEEFYSLNLGVTTVKDAVMFGAEWGIRKQEETFKITDEVIGTPRTGKTTEPRMVDRERGFVHAPPFNSGVHLTVPNRRAELLELAGKLAVAGLSKLDADDLLIVGDDTGSFSVEVAEAQALHAKACVGLAAAILDAVDRACEVRK